MHDDDALPPEKPGVEFDLEQFLPYLLNQAAEATSRSFQATYKAAFGMTRTQWRVLANLGKFGAMTARDICSLSHIEKTKVSRAVAGLEANGALTREISVRDRRTEILSLTPHGKAVFAQLGAGAVQYDTQLRAGLGVKSADILVAVLRDLIANAAVGSDHGSD